VDKINWTKPAGKTQADLDAELAADEAAERIREARTVLEETDSQVLEALEKLLDGKAYIDQTILDRRKAARGILKNRRA